MFKKVLSGVLSLSMLFGGSISAFASNEVTNQSDSFSLEIVKINEDTYKTITNIDGTLFESISTKNDEMNTVKMVVTKDGDALASEILSLSDLTTVGEAFIKESNEERSIKNSFMAVTAASNYTFDGISMTSESRTQPYAHPDKVLYNIAPYENWHKEGYSKHFIQFNQYDSSSFTQMPAWAIGGVVGAVLTGIYTKNGYAAIVGGAIGGFVGAYLGGQAGRVLDEDGCFWLIVDKSPLYVNNAWRVNYIQLGGNVQRYVDLTPFNGQ